jgi:hypothetical protein
MSDRRLRILVAVAVVAGIAVAAVGFATQGSGKSRAVLQVDEQNGRIGRVVLGETKAEIVGVLGKPESQTAVLLRYPQVAITLENGRATSIATSSADAKTDLAVRIGDPLSAVRASYRKAAKCNPNSPDKTAAHPHCFVIVPAGGMEVYGDPVREIRLVRTR